MLQLLRRGPSSSGGLRASGSQALEDDRLPETTRRLPASGFRLQTDGLTLSSRPGSRSSAQLADDVSELGEDEARHREADGVF